MYLRYYPALRTLEQLERTCLPKAGQYRFCSIMSENIPKLRTQIRDTAMTQLRDFLESIRKHSDKIGETAIKQVHEPIMKREERELKLVLLACFVFVLHLDLLAVCPDCRWLDFYTVSKECCRCTWICIKTHTLPFNTCLIMVLLAKVKAVLPISSWWKDR